MNNSSPTSIILMWYNDDMEEKVAAIKKWLDTGAINIFGLPMSGKDTQGIKLAELLEAKFLSSGMIIRAMEKETQKYYTADGQLAPTNIFYEWVLPYLERRDLFEYPLVLSSIGRWFGEENQVMMIAAGAGHEIKAVVSLEISEEKIKERFLAAKSLNDRGERLDDQDLKILKTRLKEFREKTLPVIDHYDSLGLLIRVNGDQGRDEVMVEIVEKLYQKTLQSRA